MLKRNKYVFDTSDLRFLQHKRQWSEKLLRFSIFFGISILLTVCYSFIFHRVAGYPNQEKLVREIEEIKLNYSLLERKIDYSSAVIADMRSTDNNSYRSILDLQEIPSDISEGGAGGTFRFGDLTGYINTEMMTSQCDPGLKISKPRQTYSTTHLPTSPRQLLTGRTCGRICRISGLST